MTTRYLFLLSAGVSMCISFADGVLHATLPCKGEREVASGQTVAVLTDNCLLSGVIAEKDGDSYAEFEVNNPNEQKEEVSFYYSVQCTPPMSPMSRMMPIPRVITNGVCNLSVESKGEQIERILIPREATENGSAKATQTSPLVMPRQWVLIVSSSAITNRLAWGGVPPVTASLTNKLGNGVLILARTVSSRVEDKMKQP
jgi:hypothetical protein